VASTAVGDTAAEFEKLEDRLVQEEELENPEDEDVEELEIVPPMMSLPPLPFENLEYLPEVTEAEIVAQSDRGDGRTALIGAAEVESTELRILLDGRHISVLSVPELLDIVEASSESIEMVDGVYRIRDEVYSGASGAAGGELGSLARSVIGGSGGGLPAAKDRIIEIGPRGADYDQFLTQFPGPITDRVVFRSLIAISQNISAVCVILLANRGSAYVPVLNVGVDDQTLESFVFTREEPICQDILDRRNALVLNAPFDAISFLKHKVSDEDLSYVKRAMFLPAVYDKEDAYLFFGFAKDRRHTAREILAGLKAVPASEAAPV
jgi:hypothetical protein